MLRCCGHIELHGASQNIRSYSLLLGKHINQYMNPNPVPPPLFSSVVQGRTGGYHGGMKALFSTDTVQRLLTWFQREGKAYPWGEEISPLSGVDLRGNAPTDGGFRGGRVHRPGGYYPSPAAGPIRCWMPTFGVSGGGFLRCGGGGPKKLTGNS